MTRSDIDSALDWLAEIRARTNDAFMPLWLDESRYLVLKGGGGSGKSIFAGDKIIERCCDEPGHRMLVCRKVAKTLRESCFQQLVNQAYDLHPGEVEQVNKGDMGITFRNGSQILFAGLDDVEKLKSIYNITGIWIEEASEISEADFNQLDIRLRGETAYYKQIIITFNPVSIQHWLKKRFFDTVDPRCRTSETTYKDNRFLDDEAIRTLESFKGTDDYYYDVYCLGNWGVTGNTIFNAADVNHRLMELPECRCGRFVDGEYHEERDGILSVYKPPEKGVPYVIGADTAGNGSDYNVAQVLDNRTGEQVATLRLQTGEVAFAEQLFDLGMYYNTALIGVETNFSTYVVLELERRQYPKQYVRQAIDQYTHKPTERFGFNTNANSRETIISNLVDVSKDIWLINDKATLEEMLTFVRNEKQRAEAELGAHDDCIMSLAIAHYIRPQQSYVAEVEDNSQPWTESMWEDYRNCRSKEEREYLIQKWGKPK